MAKLALQARDSEDLAVISAHLQDAVGVMGDVAYLPRDRRFAMVVNRFMWERQKGSLLRPAQPLRVKTGLHFDGVLDAKVQQLPIREADFAFELLAIRFLSSGLAEDPGGVVELDFAGGGTVRLTVECLEVWMADLSEPWIAKSKPLHHPE